MAVATPTRGRAGTAVELGSVQTVNIMSSTEIVASSPPGTPGRTAAITVTADTLPSVLAFADLFTCREGSPAKTGWR